MSVSWTEVAIGPGASMREAMETLDSGARQIVLVMDPDGCHLLGTVTDGDVRRALLKGKTMDAPTREFMNPNPVTGLVEEGRAIWQRTMERHTLRHLPLLNAAGCVAELVSYEVPAEPVRSNAVVLMAGGLGTRLRPLTDTMPKPLIPVGSKPVLETIIDSFVAQGFNNLFVCINYLGSMIRDRIGDGARWGISITYLEEERPLGTAGALSLLPERPSEPVIVMNGDLLTGVDFVRVLEFHAAQRVMLTVAMREYVDRVPYGVLELGEGYRIVRLTEKPSQRHHVSAGIYVIEPEVLDLIPSGSHYDMTELVNGLLSTGKAVGSFPIRDYWIDIGQLEDLEQAHNDYEEGLL